MARPDVVIGAKATDDAGWLWTTNSRDFFKAFPLLSGTVCACATSPREARV